MEIGELGWGWRDEREKSLCFVQPDVKDDWCFSCIVSFLTVSLINGVRGQKKNAAKHYISASENLYYVQKFNSGWAMVGDFLFILEK